MRTQALPVPTTVEEFLTPRWSPDDRSIAFVADEGSFRFALYLLDTADGKSRVVARASQIRGIAWLPDGSRLVYASSSGTTLLYPSILNLRMVSLEGGTERQLTVGDASYMEPDIMQAGKIFASRVNLQSDIWGFPVSGSPTDNVKNGIRITRQTGQVQTPSASPDGKEIAYLSDTGGHSNVWVAKIDGSGVRQLTFERDPAVIIGIPVWSPVGDRVVFIQTRAGVNQEWVINPDGSGLRQLVANASSAAWSADGRWLYYQRPPCVYRVPSDGGVEVQVRCDAAVPLPSAQGTTLYYSPRHYRNANEIFKATPPDGEGTLVARYAPSRVPHWPTGHVLSPDDRWIAAPLKDGATTNLWAIPTDGGPFRQLTDFGQRAILIARQVSWSPDGKVIYAAVVESDSDVVVLDGIVP